MSSKINMITAFAGGIAAGVTIGWLTAPKSGESTRRDLTKRLESGREQVQSALSDGAERARSLPPAVGAATQAATQAAGEAFRERLANGASH